MKEYVIPVYGLKPGIHNYEFELNQSFFESFDSELLDNPNIRVELLLEKTSNMVILNFTASGTGEVPCDRCGDTIEIPLECTDRVIVKYGEEKPIDVDDIIVLLPNEHELDVSQRIHEMLVLNMPLKLAHESLEDCDQDVIKRLSGNERNEDNDIDPRWEALRKLK
ncbi:MAG TPA: DUF177 domain-containing protein [Cryomorphaceae bacterium]|nr:DUF177 domain-containing protein [Cryomorphaceae bacterium]